MSLKEFANNLWKENNIHITFPTNITQNSNFSKPSHIALGNNINKIKSLPHEFEHYLNEKLSNEKYNLLKNIYMDNDNPNFTISFVKKFYPKYHDELLKLPYNDYLKEVERITANEFQADNAAIRYQIAKKYGVKTLKDIEKKIDNLSDEELINMLYDQSSYMKYLMEYSKLNDANSIVNFIDKAKVGLKYIPAVSTPIGIGIKLNNSTQNLNN